MKEKKRHTLSISVQEAMKRKEEYIAWVDAAEKLQNASWHIDMRCNPSATIPESLAIEIRSSIKQLVMVLSWFDSEGGLDVIKDH